MGQVNGAALQPVNRVEQVADALLGSCRDLSDEATPEEIGSLAFCTALDQYVMLCETCNWWCESDDIDDDGNCSECSEHEREWSRP